MQPQIVEGDLLDQEVDAIVNAWNRNVIPWWLLLPSGVSVRWRQTSWDEESAPVPWGTWWRCLPVIMAAKRYQTRSPVVAR